MRDAIFKHVYKITYIDDSVGYVITEKDCRIDPISAVEFENGILVDTEVKSIEMLTENRPATDNDW